LGNAEWGIRNGEGGFKQRGARQKIRNTEPMMALDSVFSVIADCTIYIICAKHRILNTKHLMNLPLKIHQCLFLNKRS